MKVFTPISLFFGFYLSFVSFAYGSGCSSSFDIYDKLIDKVSESPQDSYAIKIEEQSIVVKPIEPTKFPTVFKKHDGGWGNYEVSNAINLFQKSRRFTAKQWQQNLYIVYASDCELFTRRVVSGQEVLQLEFEGGEKFEFYYPNEQAILYNEILLPIFECISMWSRCYFY